MQDFKKYIVPFVDNEVKGCGFFIRDYFITAGHMFEKAESLTIFFNGQYHTFNKCDAIYLKSIKEDTTSELTQDIAIFKFEGVDSPLKLCGHMPYVNTVLTNYSFIPTVGQLNPFDMLITECQVLHTLFNFFECKTDTILKEGSSGSPLIADDVVYGILSGCINEAKYPENILFCSTLNLPTL